MVVKKKHILLGFLALTILSVFFVHAFSSEARGALKSLKLIPIEEPMTELYFNNYLSLPNHIEKGTPLMISFTIHNLEGKDALYTYTISVKNSGGPKVLLNSNFVMIPNGAFQIINESYTPNSSAPLEFIIGLPLSNQEIHFVVPRDNNI